MTLLPCRACGRQPKPHSDWFLLTCFVPGDHDITVGADTLDGCNKRWNEVNAKEGLMPFDESNDSVNGEFSTFGPALENEEGIDGSDDPQEDDE